MDLVWIALTFTVKMVIRIWNIKTLNDCITLWIFNYHFLINRSLKLSGLFKYMTSRENHFYPVMHMLRKSNSHLHLFTQAFPSCIDIHLGISFLWCDMFGWNSNMNFENISNIFWKRKDSLEDFWCYFVHTF
jgi:hypothetical protein